MKRLRLDSANLEEVGFLQRGGAELLKSVTHVGWNRPPFPESISKYLLPRATHVELGLPFCRTLTKYINNSNLIELNVYEAEGTLTNFPTFMREYDFPLLERLILPQAAKGESWDELVDAVSTAGGKFSRLEELGWNISSVPRHSDLLAFGQISQRIGKSLKRVTLYQNGSFHHFLPATADEATQCSGWKNLISVLSQGFPVPLSRITISQDRVRTVWSCCPNVLVPQSDSVFARCLPSVEDVGSQLQVDNIACEMLATKLYESQAATGAAMFQWCSDRARELFERTSLAFSLQSMSVASLECRLFLLQAIVGAEGANSSSRPNINLAAKSLQEVPLGQLCDALIEGGSTRGLHFLDALLWDLDDDFWSSHGVVRDIWNNPDRLRALNPKLNRFPRLAALHEFDLKPVCLAYPDTVLQWLYMLWEERNTGISTENKENLCVVFMESLLDCHPGGLEFRGMPGGPRLSNLLKCTRVSVLFGELFSNLIAALRTLAQSSPESASALLSSESLDRLRVLLEAHRRRYNRGAGYMEGLEQICRTGRWEGGSLSVRS